MFTMTNKTFKQRFKIDSSQLNELYFIVISDKFGKYCVVSQNKKGNFVVKRNIPIYSFSNN